MKWMRVALVFLVVSTALVAAHFGLSNSSQLVNIEQETKVAHYPDTLTGGDFHLLAHDGRQVSLSSFPERNVLLIFGYTFCPDICPTSLATISESLALLDGKAGEVQPLFITLDPERDSAVVLAQYLENFDPRILGLTGTLAEVEDVASRYRVYFAKYGEGADYTVDHSAAYYLVDPRGNVLTYLPHDASAEDLARAIRKNSKNEGRALSTQNPEPNASGAS